MTSDKLIDSLQRAVCQATVAQREVLQHCGTANIRVERHKERTEGRHGVVVDVVESLSEGDSARPLAKIEGAEVRMAGEGVAEGHDATGAEADGLEGDASEGRGAADSCG